jgi:hypothetical protein
MAGFCRLALEWPRLEIETSARRWREHSAYGTVAMPRMYFSQRYAMYPSSVDGAGKVSRSAAAAALGRLAIA